ncbi:dicarboxylate/amino acid:cation symporter [Phycisphaera mikurensis]|uniref:Putative proton glutamate symporter n=1 Tax=Phycisphaera mikurensis (strain NBRC 102666 / KCTC 22515 / FYK2301M01) TaxID=1142394 RepID=I0IB93_PHYMF|nr:dicarboxylate/amino acid:cation symporter [Phycisphaera mikurensis]MBB6443029.1 Na+/H+-dicarboxylate symporter [Phycisphaera mikurensis]BAM02531.1 putative proton glutamate symporter [Phycisphaera mikurensis NBRC 102666]
MPTDPDRPAGPDAPSREKPGWFALHRWPLHTQILLGLVIGAAIGWALGASGVSAHADDPAAAAAWVTASWPYLLLDLAGDLFLNGLRLIIVPLVTTSILLAMIGIGRGPGVGRLGLITLGYYTATSAIAIFVGLTLVNLVAPGLTGDGVGLLAGADLDAFASDQAALEDRTGDAGLADFLNVFRELVPANVFAAAAADKLLGLICVSLLLGLHLARRSGDARDTLVRLVRGVYDATLWVTDLVLRTAPIGVVGLLGATVAEQYARLVPDARFGAFALGLLTFAGTALAALLVHALVVMPIVLLLLARVNPIAHLRGVFPALVTAFSTASSSATLPLTMSCVEERCGVDRKVAGFTLPLGATVNMDGTALYECVAAVFICQAFGVDLTLPQQAMIVATALLTSIGVAGVPAASLVAIIVILEAVQAQLPAAAPPLIAGLGLLYVFDRPLDMCRTAVNVLSDSVAARVVAARAIRSAG